MKKSKTQRGFAKGEFKDLNGVECKIQQSSIATKKAIWLGAKKIGLSEFVAFRQPNAWEDRPEVDEFKMDHHFNANTQMHLSQAQVKKLLPILQKFAETGELF